MAQKTATNTSLADRQRERAARGIGTRNASRFGGDKPSPPRRRRPALAAIAVLLIVGGAALAGLLALRLDSRQPVLVVSQDVAAGTEITQDLLSSTDVAADGLQLVPADQASEIIGTYTQVPLAAGQLIETPALTQAEPFGSDRAQVGIPLDPNASPSGLRSGDLIRLVRVGDGNTPPTPIATALVLSTSSSTSGGSLASDGSTSSSATVLVPSGASDDTVDAAANERLGISLLERGVTVEDAGLQTLGGSR